MHPEGVRPQYFGNQKYEGITMSDAKKVDVAMKVYNAMKLQNAIIVYIAWTESTGLTKHMHSTRETTGLR